MKFPFFRRAGSVVLLDDNSDFLAMLSVSLASVSRVRAFDNQRDCVTALMVDNARGEEIRGRQRAMISSAKEGTSLAQSVMDFWTDESEERFTANVLLIDYAMPGENGLQVLGSLADWHGARLMLTGVADERVAIVAFNQGLIDQFIPKQVPDFVSRIKAAIALLGDTADVSQNGLWAAALKPLQVHTLANPAVENALQVFCHKHWVEHAVISEPFGVLGKDRNGEVGFLQIETPESANGLAEICRDSGFGEIDCSLVAAGTKICNVELQSRLNPDAAPALADSFVLTTEPLLRAAYFPLGNSDSRNPE